MLGENPLLSWKSKRTQEQEAEEYEKWAFPYGAEQREKLEALLTELFPKEPIANSLIPFLTCKELFDQAMKNNGSEEAATNHLLNGIKKYKMIIRKREMPMYLAAVLADRRIDFSLQYQSADEVRAKAQELELRRAER